MHHKKHNQIDPLPDPEKFTITLPEAICRTQLWRIDHPGGNELRSFTIKPSDIENLAFLFHRYPDLIGGFRAYLGMKNIEVLSPYSLIFVPTDLDGKDMFCDPLDPMVSAIYDFSVPCPSTCGDPSSILAVGVCPDINDKK